MPKITGHTKTFTGPSSVKASVNVWKREDLLLLNLDRPAGGKQRAEERQMRTGCKVRGGTPRSASDAMPL